MGGRVKTLKVGSRDSIQIRHHILEMKIGIEQTWNEIGIIHSGIKDFTG
jgi:hypothetical protein